MASGTASDVRLRSACDEIRTVFGGMVAHPEETNCACHWGGPEELALLKTPDVPLEPSLLYRTWSAPDWSHHPAVIRRILPQLTQVMLTGGAADQNQIGWALARAGWQAWPVAQSGALSRFLSAWWAHILGAPYPARTERTVRTAQTAQTAHKAFATCATASATVTPWLARWATRRGPAADQHLLDAVECWIDDLEIDDLPSDWWYRDDNKSAVVVELNRWLAEHAPARLASRGADPALIDRVRKLGLPMEARWDDPTAP